MSTEHDTDRVRQIFHQKAETRPSLPPETSTHPSPDQEAYQAQLDQAREKALTPLIDFGRQVIKPIFEIAIEEFNLSASVQVMPEKYHATTSHSECKVSLAMNKINREIRVIVSNPTFTSDTPLADIPPDVSPTLLTVYTTASPEGKEIALDDSGLWLDELSDYIAELLSNPRLLEPPYSSSDDDTEKGASNPFQVTKGITEE